MRLGGRIWRFECALRLSKICAGQLKCSPAWRRGVSLAYIVRQWKMALLALRSGVVQNETASSQATQ
jgi:hypothetical protein